MLYPIGWGFGDVLIWLVMGFCLLSSTQSLLIGVKEQVAMALLIGVSISMHLFRHVVPGELYQNLYMWIFCSFGVVSVFSVWHQVNIISHFHYC